MHITNGFLTIDNLIHPSLVFILKSRLLNDKRSNICIMQIGQHKRQRKQVSRLELQRKLKRLVEFKDQNTPQFGVVESLQCNYWWLGLGFQVLPLGSIRFRWIVADYDLGFTMGVSWVQFDTCLLAICWKNKIKPSTNIVLVHPMSHSRGSSVSFSSEFSSSFNLKNMILNYSKTFKGQKWSPNLPDFEELLFFFKSPEFDDNFQQVAKNIKKVLFFRATSDI